MGELAVQTGGLPTKIDDLAKFVLVGREKLNAVRAEIRAIDKVGLAEEVRRQKLREGQDIAEAVLDAEVRIGELMAVVPKATKGTGANQYQATPIAEIDTVVDFSEQPTKSEVIQSAGLTQKQVERFQQMAARPEIVEQAKAEARENDEIVTRSAVLNLIQEQKTPHVAYNAGNNEWYTPPDYIDAARAVMGTIDIDPASSEIANRTVGADTYYTAETNGLDKPWRGNVWMNPPYASDLIGKFVDKLIAELPNIRQAIILVNNATESAWFGKLIEHATAVCFPHGRVRFLDPEGRPGAPLQGQAIIYIGSNVDVFVWSFRNKGWCALPQ